MALKDVRDLTQPMQEEGQQVARRRPPRCHPTYVKAAVFAGMPEYQLKASGRPMVEYQVYILADGDRIKRREDIVCEDDEAAKKRARQMVDGHAVELWQATRKIA